MIFKKDGKVYGSIESVVGEHCQKQLYCFACVLYRKRDTKCCKEYANENPEEVAHLLDLEVIDDTPNIAEVVEKYGDDVKPDPTWQERMQKEYRELKERYEKLHKMVTKYEAGTLGFTPNCSLELLCQQKRHMGEYLHDLEIRAEIEGVEL